MLTGAAVGGVGMWDLAALGGAGLLGLLYGIGLSRLWRRTGPGAAIRRSALLAVAGWIALVVAVGPPLAGLSDLLFAAHMGQHELLMLVAAPLLVLGRTLWVAAWGLPRSARLAVVRTTRRPAMAGAWSWLTSPVTVLVLQAVVLWGWHVPAAFEAALSHDALHAVQHLMFFSAAALFWWALVHGRFGRLGYGTGVLVVFATAMHSGLLGAMITFAARPIYATHASRAAAHGVGPLEDQQLAGLLMWVPAGLLLTIGGLALFAAWLGELARRNERAARAAGRGLHDVRRDPASERMLSGTFFAFVILVQSVPTA